MKYVLGIIFTVFIFSTAPVLMVQAKPETPTSLKTSYRTTRNAYISIKNVPFSTKAQFQYYRVQILHNNKVVKAKSITTDLDQKRTGVTIRALKPNYHYTARVRTVTTTGTSKWIEKEFTTTSGVTNKLKPEFVDMLAHASVSGSQANLSDITTALGDWNISHQVLAPVPSPLEGFKNGDQASEVVEFIGEDTDNTFSVLYGGIKLNPILHALGGENEITEEAVFPNGTKGDVSGNLVDTQAILDNPTEWENRFRNRATEAAESGNYAGFGELSPLHLSYYTGHPYITFPADQELMLWLSDLAAEHDMYLLIHLEPTTGKLQQLENLLDHNPNTKIVWDHIGWYETDLSRPRIYKNMLEQHDNLYILIKMRNEDAYTAHRPIKRDGTLRSSWRTLFTSYSDRIMLSTDAKYWEEEDDNLKKSLLTSVEPLQQLYDQLPKSTVDAITNDTAASLLQLE